MEIQPGLQHSSLDHEKNRLEPTLLSNLAAGKTGTVCHLAGDKEFIERVACLGFTIGAQVTVLHNQGQGPLIVAMHGAHIALGRQETNLIQVRPL